MQKQQVNFFERHVQWFAVGLGALFLGFMVWAYVIQSPIVVKAGGKEFAGEIDDATLAGPIAELKRDIANPVVPKIENPDLISKFIATIRGENQDVAELTNPMFAARPMGGKIVPIPTDQDAPKDFVITELPVPPVATPVKHVYGRSTVVMLDPDFKPNPKKPNAAAKEIEVDLDWWSGNFKISSDQLFKAFTAAFDVKRIEAANLDPSFFMQTAFVDVELVRQERLADGKWGKEVVVKPLKISERLPFPGASAKDDEVGEYLDWAVNSREELLAPAFYEVKSGDEYESPLQLAEAEEDPEAKERRKELALERRTAKEEQLKAKKKADNESKAAAAKQRADQARANRANRGAGGGGGGGAGGPGGMRMPSNMGQAPGAGGPGTMRMPSGFGPGGGPSGAMPTPNPYGAMPGGMNRQGMPMQQGFAGGGMGGAARFEVAEGGDDIQIVAHDDSIQPGKTYRYRVRYSILNPVYKSFRTAPDKLTKQFYITSKEESPWTKPVTIRAKVEFFLAQVRPDKATFDVFEWSEGKMQKHTVDVSPGDSIGDTNFSVVDIRGSGRKAYVLLMDGTGGVDRYNPQKENESPRYQELLEEVDQGTAVSRR